VSFPAWSTIFINCDDCKSFFRAKQERTASSPSGHYFRLYKALVECKQMDNLAASPLQWL